MNNFIYRVHYSSPCEHETYFDFKTLKTAQAHLLSDNDTSDFFAYKISIIPTLESL